MKRTNRLAAMCLALAGGISATVALAGTNVTATSETPSSAEFSHLATDLADTAASLADLQETYSPDENGTEEFYAKDESKTTVHWLSNNSKQLSSNARIDIEITPAMATDPMIARSVIARDIVRDSAPAPRPAAMAYRQDPIALAVPTTSTIIRAQANEEIFYTAQAAQGELSPQSGEMDWRDPVFCNDDCCDTCCSPALCCPKPRPRRIVVVSTEAVFLSPTANGTPVSYRFDNLTTPQIVQFGPDYGDADLDNFYGAPRISLGWQGPCWGLVGRYYHLRAAESAFGPLLPSGQFLDHSFNASSILEAYYTDLELTRNFCLHGMKSQFSFGARYALISHDESIYGRSLVDAAGTPSILQGGARRNRQAHGTGLTMALNGRKPLFCNSCAHWFYNVRSSILWGTNQSDVESWADVTAGASGSSAVAGSIDTAHVIVDDDLFIGEVQVGIQWDFALRCLPAKAFFRTAFEYQYWDASTGLAASGSFAGIDAGGDTYQVTTGSSAPGLIVDFVGLSVGTGFTW